MAPDQTPNTNVNDASDTQAAQEAAQQAVAQARETAHQAVETLKSLDSNQLVYLGCLTTIVIFTLIFDMASFSVGLDVAVSETTAQAQREAEAKLNAWAYSAFTSTFWGKLMWVSAVGGIGLMIWGAIHKSRAAFFPLAQIGSAAFCTLCLLLLLAVGFPDLSAYDDASCSATLLGYWIPLLAACAATFFSVKPLLGGGDAQLG